ncbi:aromatic ring-hydroxylating dioxygenase subunit alpha [Roseivivax sp. GX 12232]|uniref:aromatic ring-hydroxylating oxygenase subunit alpha n=1 Tax=Roseivivax sp. GX 12232 TaxID=2900547 RepID=UPI001E2B62CE|nr:aromatic ring-hydroxylating dioxygenase subunit alpha [Roseivivax sp. GX 12232]MCE0506167.1 aromatic ring-hydroxylating dioxygenase subunit alpha [Roseivivax sp. GX 12232]
MDPREVQSIKDQQAYESKRGGPPEGFPQLPDIPGGRYVDPEFNRLEIARMWHKTWVYAIHADEVPEVGSYVQWTRLGEPLFFIRGEDQEVRCFYNTCRHRGAPVVTEENGKSRGVTCKYHGWTYNTRGELINLRDRRDFVDLDMSCRGLIQVRCENIGNLYFVNLDPEAEPLRDYLGPAARDLDEVKPETLILVDKQAIQVNCNVKILLDAFMETYHLKSIHQNTVDRFLDHRGTAITLWDKGHSRMVTPYKREGWKDPGVKGLPEVEGADPFFESTNYSMFAFPNFVSPIAPAGIPVLCFWPDSIDTMTIEVHWFAPSWGEGPRPEVWDMRLKNFLHILDEDLQFADKIQKSVESAGLRGFPLNYQERRIYHWHAELDKCIGAADVPETLRVPDRLGDWVSPFTPAEAAKTTEPAEG